MAILEHTSTFVMSDISASECGSITVTTQPAPNGDKLAVPTHWSTALLQFARPHTIVGTSLAVCVFWVLASAPVGRWDVVLLVKTWIASLCVNVYVVGINQLTDISIDRINKPYLPLASGAFSVSTGRMLCAFAGIGAVLAAAWVGRWLFGTISIVAALGTAYSLPPLRLKRYPVFAMASIVIARAIVAHLGVYMSYRSVLVGSVTVPLEIGAFVAFQLAFVVVISAMKDVPDIEGDRKHQISTFVANLGAVFVMNACRCVLTFAYIAMGAAAAMGAFAGLHAQLIAATHIAGCLAVWLRAWKCNDDDPKQSYS